MIPDCNSLSALFYRPQQSVRGYEKGPTSGPIAPRKEPSLHFRFTHYRLKVGHVSCTSPASALCDHVHAHLPRCNRRGCDYDHAPAFYRNSVHCRRAWWLSRRSSGYNRHLTPNMIGVALPMLDVGGVSDTENRREGHLLRAESTPKILLAKS